jgi:hypothetical protein
MSGQMIFSEMPALSYSSMGIGSTNSYHRARVVYQEFRYDGIESPKITTTDLGAIGDRESLARDRVPNVSDATLRRGNILNNLGQTVVSAMPIPDHNAAVCVALSWVLLVDRGFIR